METGNPTDSARCPAMLERHRKHYSAAPSHAAFDGGYTSRDSLAQANAAFDFAREKGLDLEKAPAD